MPQNAKGDNYDSEDFDRLSEGQSEGHSQIDLDPPDDIGMSTPRMAFPEELHVDGFGETPFVTSLAIYTPPIQQEVEYIPVGMHGGKGKASKGSKDKDRIGPYSSGL